MTLDQIGSRLKVAAARFARSERGNVAMMFVVTMPVLLSAVGAAIDYSRAVNARSAMQAAIDATTLMISKEASNLNPSDITTKAQAYFNALYNRPDVATATFSAVYSPNSGNGASVKIDATGTIQTDFMKFAGVPTMTLGSSTTTKWGNMRYRVALALDNTGSMASASKMDELKKAATTLIGDFDGMATTDADVYISIVPFARDVNLGKSFKNQAWVRWTEWEETNGSCSSWWAGNKKSTCEGNGKTWTASNHDTWNGCVMDRNESYDTTNFPPSAGVTATMVPAEQYGDCPVQMMEMTSVKASKQTLLDKINAMQPKGSTNQGIGTFWAWMTHSTSGPFTIPAKDSNYSYIDVIILLTDGLNTQNRLYGDGYNHSSQVDARQAILCTNIKAAGMMVFAIQVATSNEPISTVTKNCVSEPNNPNYFSYVTQASQMTVKFKNIFKELSKLRVAS
jgi:Flp pilus assembly protein TadG